MLNNCIQSAKHTLLVCSISGGVWAQTPQVNSVIISGSNNSREYAMEMDEDHQGNLLIAGSSDRQIDLDPGSGSMVMTTNGESSPFVQKLDRQGNLVWAKFWNYASDDFINYVKTAPNGDVYALLTFEGNSFDADPSSNYFNVYGVGNNESTPCLVKLSSTGQFEWAVAFKGGFQRNNSIAIGSSGHVTISMEFSDSIDVDPNVFLDSIVYSHSPGSSDLLVQQYDAQGNHRWTRICSGAGTIVPYSNVADVNGDILVSGGYRSGSIDFDPNPSSTELRYRNLAAFKGFVLRLDSVGAYKNVTVMQGPGESFIRNVIIDGGGSFYTAGYYEGIVDLDPGAVTTHMNNRNGYQTGYFYQRFDNLHQMTWATNHSSGLPTTSNFRRDCIIEIDEENNVYMGAPFSDSLFLEPHKIQGERLASDLSQYTIDMYLIKYNMANDSVVWSYSPYAVSGQPQTFLRAVAPSPSEVFVLGFTPNKLRFNSPSSQQYGISGDQQIFLLELDNCESVPYTETLDTAVCDSFVAPTGQVIRFRGNYQVNYTVLNADGCDSIQRTINVTVQKSNIPYINKHWWGLEFTPSPIQEYVQWYDCDKDSILPGDTSTIFLPKVSGSYAVIYSDTSGCLDTSHCFTFNNIGLLEDKVSGLSLFPNPANNTLHVKGNGMQVEEIKVLDVQGRHIITFTNQGVIDVSGLESGTYIVKVKTDKGILMRKIVKI